MQHAYATLSLEICGFAKAMRFASLLRMAPPAYREYFDREPLVPTGAHR